ncbi:MAG: ABC transporter substrate-binding protein [Ruminococcus sp.]|nr:ABC transporter substrate-binding protein [Ruminococcus sp.]
MKRYALIIPLIFLTSCGTDNNNTNYENAQSMQLEYAQQFTVESDGDISHVKIGNGDEFIILPEDADIPDEYKNMKIIRKPVENIYLASSSVMDLFSGIDCLDLVKFTSTKESDWSAEYVKKALENGDILYAGKYRTPDFELLLSENCGLAIENTMIYHTPEIKEQLENLGIPVIVEYSSYEPHPLGRMEWIKLYGLLTGHENEAEKLFSEKARQVENLKIDDINPDEKKSVAFFYITSSGYASVRKPNDYVSKMIELAGGRYIFTADDLNVDENALSTMNMQIESFYEKAKDADIIIYNSTIDGEIENISQLTEKCSILSDFRAVRNNNAWCSEKDMFQQTGASADIIIEMNKIITDSAEDDMEFIHRIKSE